MLSVVESKIDERLKSNNDNPFYLFDVNDIREKVKYWREKLPNVEPYYAVKCNKNSEIMKAIESLGLGFECASKGEVEKVLELQIDPKRIIYSHTVKQLSHLQFCAENGVTKMTFDSPEELMRIKENHPEAEVFIRIRIDKIKNPNLAEIKFGCDIEKEAEELIKLCRDHQMKLIGFNFHIGSITDDYQIYERALNEVTRLFDKASAYGFKLTFVNIGGGFYGWNKKCLDSYADHINKGIQKLLPSLIVAEPGRYFVESAGVLATQIILKKTSVDGHVHYYINEGVFLSFLFNLVYGRTNPTFSIIRKTSKNTKKKIEEKFSTVWGCSCHYIDKIIVKQNIPEMEIGDWIIFDNMGSYTECASSNFNGFNIGETLVFDSSQV